MPALGTPTYVNQISEREVSLAIEHFLIAPFPTAYTPGRVDVNSPPAGFRHLGAVDEESVSLTATRNKFQIKTGIPQVLQYQAVTGLDARAAFTLHARDTRKALYALGNWTNDQPKYIAPNSLTSLAAVGSAGQVTLAAAPANTWYVNDEVVTAPTSAGWATANNFAVIASINGLVITLDPPFASAPSAGDLIGKPVGHRAPLGTSIIRTYTLLGIADFIDGFQAQHWIPKCQPVGEWAEQLRASQNTRMTLAFDAFGLPSTVWSNELVVAERLLIQKA